MLHASIIRNPLTNVKRKMLDFRNGVTYTEAMPRKRLPPDILEFFVKMGRRGGKLGGVARAAKLSPEERSRSARRAVQARWERVRADLGRATGQL